MGQFQDTNPDLPLLWDLRGTIRTEPLSEPTGSGWEGRAVSSPLMSQNLNLDLPGWFLIIPSVRRVRASPRLRTTRARADDHAVLRAARRLGVRSHHRVRAGREHHADPDLLLGQVGPQRAAPVHVQPRAGGRAAAAHLRAGGREPLPVGGVAVRQGGVQNHPLHPADLCGRVRVHTDRPLCGQVSVCRQVRTGESVRTGEDRWVSDSWVSEDRRVCEDRLWLKY